MTKCTKDTDDHTIHACWSLLGAHTHPIIFSKLLSGLVRDKERGFQWSSTHHHWQVSMRNFIDQAFTTEEPARWTNVTAELVRELIRETIISGVEQDSIISKQQWAAKANLNQSCRTYSSRDLTTQKGAEVAEEKAGAVVSGLGSGGMVVWLMIRTI